MFFSPFLSGFAPGGGLPGTLAAQAMGPMSVAPNIPTLQGARGGLGPVPSIPGAPLPPPSLLSSLLSDPKSLASLASLFGNLGSGSAGPIGQNITWWGTDPFTYGPSDALGFAGLSSLGGGVLGGGGAGAAGAGLLSDSGLSLMASGAVDSAPEWLPALAAVF